MDQDPPNSLFLFNHHFKGPSFKYRHILRPWRSGLQHLEFGGTQFGQSHFPVLIYSWSRGAAGGTQRPLRGLALGPREAPHPCSQSPTVKHRRAGVPGWCSDPGCPRPKSRRGQWGAAGSSGETAFWTLPPGCCGQLRVTAGFWSCPLPSATGPHQLQAGPARPAATGLEGEDLPCSSMRMRAARAHLITRDPLSTPRLIPPNTGRPFPCWCASLQSQGFSSHVGARPSNHRETLHTLVHVPPITGRLFPRWCAFLQSQGVSPRWCTFLQSQENSPMLVTRAQGGA